MALNNQKLKQISSHHWLKARGSQSFHAYLSGASGTLAVCGAQGASLADMEIPGSRSKCCIECFNELYEIDLSTFPLKKS